MVARFFDRLKRLKVLGPKRVEIQMSAEVLDRASDRLLEMDEALEELLGLPGLERFGETQDLPREFFALWARALAAYDLYVDTMSEGLPTQIQCRKGCTACCHDVPTGVQAVEYLALYQAYRRLPDYEQLHNAAVDLGELLRAKLTEAGVSDTASLMSDSDDYRAAQLAFRNSRSPCVFLDGESGECRVYAWRPIPCRMHVSMSDPQWCWSDDERAADAQTPNFAPPQTAVDTMREIAVKLGLHHLSPSLFHGVTALNAQVMRHKPISESATKKRRGRFGKHRRG